MCFQNSYCKKSKKLKCNKHYQQQQQQQQTKYGVWGHDITIIHNENVHFVFQNINGRTSFTGVHESLKERMVALNGTVTALAETNVNWNNFTFHDA